MEILKEQELETIQGGGLSLWGVGGIIAAAIFIVGFFDGLTRPLKCDK
ncbi:MAG TPA: class IIb bacteriocin, lactobin A/cerein 7B family [Candidatus Scybalousia intestinigallinarum]|nr:class IIb bacteriocin, lactobin A/cerein 7B family [Candidatus Scybalousia intestinigallinarum]